MPRPHRYTEKEFDAAVAAVVEQRNQALFENRRLKAAMKPPQPWRCLFCGRLADIRSHVCPIMRAALLAFGTDPDTIDAAEVAELAEQFAAETAPAVVEGTAGAHPRLRAVPSTPTPKETE